MIYLIIMIAPESRKSGSGLLCAFAPLRFLEYQLQGRYRQITRVASEARSFTFSSAG
jgi:hypothetical protein